jgi:hypothetical protein
MVIYSTFDSWLIMPQNTTVSTASAPRTLLLHMNYVYPKASNFTAQSRGGYGLTSSRGETRSDALLGSLKKSDLLFIFPTEQWNYIGPIIFSILCRSHSNFFRWRNSEIR